MADPLSLAASIIAVVGAADEVTKGLRRLKAAKDAPKGLQDLLEDVEQLEIVLNGVKSAVLSSGSPPIELATLTGEAGSKLLELRSLIEYILTKAGVSDKVDRWQWLKKGNEVERLRSQLGTIRLNLVALTSSANFGVLQRVSVVTQDISSEQQRLNAQVTRVLPRHEALLSHLCQRIEESQATQGAMMRLLGDFRQTEVNVASDKALALSETLGSAAITPTVARPRMRSRSEFHIQNLQIQSACPSACKCDCHKTWRIYTPRNLRKLLGHSTIEGAELPFFRPACGLRSCKGKSAMFVTIKFFLPSMIAARMISLWFTSSPLYGPELLLRVPRVLRNDTPAHEAICSGDLDAVKRSIFAGDFKPWDVDHRGESLILLALDYGRFTTALYLAQMASDNYDCLREDYCFQWYDFFGWEGYISLSYKDLTEGTAMTRLILGLRRGNGDARSLLDIESVPGVDWDEISDKNGFSELHKIVYGISSRSLEAEIKARPENLDRPDSVGLTALWYACWLGNSDYIRILIRYGADVNNNYIPPICAAVWRGSYDSVQQLLNAGASITDRWVEVLYATLMLRQSRPGGNVEEVLAIDKAIFGRLLDINYRSPDWNLCTPLVALIWWRSPHLLPRMRQLLKLGADIELCDRWGLTPLHHAICEESVGSCQILRQAGANANLRNDKGGTILHTAIRSATHANIIQALSEFDLAGVELGAKDKYGCTAFDHFKTRAGRRRNDQNFFQFNPSIYLLIPRWWFNGNQNIGFLDCVVEDIDTEWQILSSFQILLQQVQEAQGVPIEERYPLLSLNREYLMVDHNEDKPLERVTPVMPGTWPEE